MKDKPKGSPFRISGRPTVVNSHDRIKIRTVHSTLDQAGTSMDGMHPVHEYDVATKSAWHTIPVSYTPTFNLERLPISLIPIHNITPAGSAKLLSVHNTPWLSRESLSHACTAAAIAPPCATVCSPPRSLFTRVIAGNAKGTVAQYLPSPALLNSTTSVLSHQPLP